jgi:hypothetical protein
MYKETNYCKLPDIDILFSAVSCTTSYWASLIIDYVFKKSMVVMIYRLKISVWILL